MPLLEWTGDIEREECRGDQRAENTDLGGTGTAFAWATNLYDNHAWWFRLGGLAVLALLVWISLRRRNQCSIAAATYGTLYGLTTWLGTFA